MMISCYLKLYYKLSPIKFSILLVQLLFLSSVLLFLVSGLILLITFAGGEGLEGLIILLLGSVSGMSTRLTGTDFMLS